MILDQMFLVTNLGGLDPWPSGFQHGFKVIQVNVIDLSQFPSLPRRSDILHLLGFGVFEYGRLGMLGQSG